MNLHASTAARRIMAAAAVTGAATLVPARAVGRTAMKRTRAFSVLLAVVVAGLAAASPASAAPATISLGDIGGYTATPPGQITQVSFTVTVPTAVTSTDCNTPGRFEYAIFGLRFGPNTFGDVSATCANSGTVAYFGDLEVVPGTVKIIRVRPGQRVTFQASANGSSMTMSMTRGFTFKSLSGSPGAFTSVDLGGWNVPGWDVPVLTTASHFTAVTVNNGGLYLAPKRRYALANGSDILLKPSAVTSANAFSVTYVAQS